MKLATDFRRTARESLRGRWGLAVGAGIVASLLGGNIASGGGGYNSSSYDDTTINEKIENLSEKVVDSGNTKLVLTIAISILVIALIVVVLHFIIGGAVQLGYAKFNLNLIDKKDASISDLFSQFSRFGTALCMILLEIIYIIGWCLLFVIPGIIKAYSYAMTPYILYENPGMSANEAITESRRVMNGNKWRLFCLYVSFIGWELLCALPLIIVLIAAFVITIVSGAVTSMIIVLLFGLVGVLATIIGALFLIPYIEASQAAFYRDITGTAVTTEEDEF